MVDLAKRHKPSHESDSLTAYFLMIILNCINRYCAFVSLFLMKNSSALAMWICTVKLRKNIGTVDLHFCVALDTIAHNRNRALNQQDLVSDFYLNAENRLRFAFFVIFINHFGSYEMDLLINVQVLSGSSLLPIYLFWLI